MTETEVLLPSGVTVMGMTGEDALPENVLSPG